MMSIPVLELKLIKHGLLSNLLKISTPEEAIIYALPHFKGLAVEHLKVLVLNADNRLIGIYTVSTGTIDQSAVYPREVLRPVLMSNGTACILMHNHPSGRDRASQQDIDMTEKIKHIAEDFNIEIHDHIIFGELTARSVLTNAVFQYSNLRKEELTVNEKQQVTIGEYKGHPTITLSNGSRNSFTFGISKAKAIIDNIEAIKQFFEENKPAN